MNLHLTPSFVNKLTNTTSVCNVTGQVVNSCNNLSGSSFNAPEGITLSQLGNYAYITNAGDKNVVVCNILQDNIGLLTNSSATNGQFTGFGNLGLNALGTYAYVYAYVPSQILQQVFVCNVDQVNGALSTCIPSLGTGVMGPAGIVLN